MKTIKKKLATAAALFPFLLSAASNPDWINVASTIYDDNINVTELISSGTREEICPSHILNNEAAKIIFKYELYEMSHRSYVFVNHIPVYSLIYEMQVQLQSSVHYKGGVGNMFNGENPAYLNSIYLSSLFGGVSSVGLVRQYPTAGMSVLSCRTSNDLSCTDAAFRNDLNRLWLEPAGYATSQGFMSTSYSTKVDDLMNVSPSTYSPKLTSHISQRSNINNSGLTLETDYSFGYEPYRDGDRYETRSRNDKYCGPTKNSAPYNFAFFGAQNVESNSRPTSFSINVSMNTTHGSNVWLDSFTSNASIMINI